MKITSPIWKVVRKTVKWGTLGGVTASAAAVIAGTAFWHSKCKPLPPAVPWYGDYFPPVAEMTRDLEVDLRKAGEPFTFAEEVAQAAALPSSLEPVVQLAGKSAEIFQPYGATGKQKTVPLEKLNFSPALLSEHVEDYLTFLETPYEQAFTESTEQWEMIRMKRATLNGLGRLLRTKEGIPDKTRERVIAFLRQFAVRYEFTGMVSDLFTERWIKNPLDKVATYDVQRAAANALSAIKVKVNLSTCWDCIDDAEVLDFRNGYYPTKARYQEAVAFYETLHHGPVRELNIRDLEAILWVRENLLSLREHFLASSERHNIPPSFLAAFPIFNKMIFERAGQYDLLGGIKQMKGWKWLSPKDQAKLDWILRQLRPELLQPEKIPKKPVKGSTKKNLSKKQEAATWLAKIFPREIIVRDAMSDYLANVWPGDGDATIGFFQLRPEGVRKLNALTTLDIDVSALPNRAISRTLLQPREGIEAGVFTFAHLLQKEFEHFANHPFYGPFLQELSENELMLSTFHPELAFLGPNPIMMGNHLPGVFRTEQDYRTPFLFLTESVHDSPKTPTMYSLGDHLLIHFQILALESGLVDREPIPALFVGIQSEQDIRTLQQMKKGNDPYLREAAQRTLQALR